MVRKIAIFSALVAFAPQTHAGFITGVTIEDVSSEFSSNWDAENVVNGVGLVGDLHRVDGPGRWLSLNGDADPNTGETAFITFDLGSNFDLNNARIWNFAANGAAGENRREAVKDFRIFTSSTEDPSDFQLIGDYALASPRLNFIGGIFGESIIPDDIEFSARNARLVKFEIVSSQGRPVISPPRVGLSEVRFFGEVSAVPEPTSACVFAIGLVGFAIRRGRRSIR